MKLLECVGLLVELPPSAPSGWVSLPLAWVNPHCWPAVGNVKGVLPDVFSSCVFVQGAKLYQQISNNQIWFKLQAAAGFGDYPGVSPSNSHPPPNREKEFLVTRKFLWGRVECWRMRRGDKMTGSLPAMGPSKSMIYVSLKFAKQRT